MAIKTKSYSVLECREGKCFPSTQFSYKLSEQNQFGLDVTFPQQLDIDESKMSVWIPFADGNRRDGVGDVLEVGGIDLSRHRTNPVCLFDHGKQVTLPIAMALERDEQGRYDHNKYTVVLDPAAKQARLNAFFYQGNGKSLGNIDRGTEYDHAVFAEQLYNMVACKMLGAGSIGYTVKVARELPPDYEQGLPKGAHLLNVLMLEGSLVVMPANQDTVRKTLSMSRMCGKRLSPYLVKSLTPYTPSKKAQFGYEGKTLKPRPKPVLHPEQDTYRSIEGVDPGMRKKTKGESFFSSCARDEAGHCRPQGGGGSAQTPPSPSKEPPRKPQGGPNQMGATPNATNVSNFKRGDKVKARRILTWVNPKTGKTEMFARAGEVLAVVSDKPQGPFKVSNSRGQTYEFSSADIRHGGGKPVPTGSQEKKSLEDVKLKYRKGYRWSKRKSKPGHTILYADAKDLEQIRKEANDKGVLCKLAGTHDSGRERVRLIGDDSVIGDLARRFGKAVGKRAGVKDLKGGRGEDRSILQVRSDEKATSPNRQGPSYKTKRGTSSMSGALKKREKQAPPGMGGPPPKRGGMNGPPPRNGNGPPPGSTGGGPGTAMEEEPLPGEEGGMGAEGGEEVEKYSLQVLRRMHQDAMILLEEYDEMRGPLEHVDIDQHLQGKLEGLVSEIEMIEGMVQQHHPGADLGGGGMGGPPSGEEGMEPEPEMGEDTEADSGAMEEPSPEDAYEGSYKRLDPQRMKSLRTFYGKTKAACSCGKKSCKACSGKKGFGFEDGHEPGDEEHHDKDEEKEEKGMEEETPEEGMEGEEKTFHLAPHDKRSVALAQKYIGGRTSATVHGDEERMEAFHHHKNLTTVLDTADGEKEGGKLGVEDGDTPGFEEFHKGVSEDLHTQDDAVGLTTEENKHPHYKALRGASTFLKSLSMEKAFGQRHRDEAAHWQGELNPMLHEVDEDMDIPEDEEEEVEVNAPESNEQDTPKSGDTDVKSLDDIGKDIASLMKTVDTLTKVVNN